MTIRIISEDKNVHPSGDDSHLLRRHLSWRAELPGYLLVFGFAFLLLLGRGELRAAG